MAYFFESSTGRSLPLFAALALMLGSGLITACQTTDKPDYLAAKYAVAVNCARAYIDERVTPKRETEEEIGNLVRTAINACEAPMKAYIQSMIQEVLDQKRWVWIGADSQKAITEEIIITTSLALQQEYNEKEQTQ